MQRTGLKRGGKGNEKYYTKPEVVNKCLEEFKKLNIEVYEPGKAIIEKIKRVTKLSANESALGISPKAKKVLSNKKLNFTRYPDGKSKRLRSQISRKFKCNNNLLSKKS